jgi:hypothetical protein
MKKYGGMDVEIQIFLTSALVGGEWSASHRGKNPKYPVIRRLGESQNRSSQVKTLDATETRNLIP